jgi:inosine/xanthosine triphosphate pyrophosphatase family protein
VSLCVFVLQTDINNGKQFKTVIALKKHQKESNIFFTGIALGEITLEKQEI